MRAAIEIAVLVMALCLCAYAIISLRKARREQARTAQASRHLDCLKKLAQAIAASSDAQQIDEAIAETISAAFRPDGLTIHDCRPQRRIARPRLVRGIAPDLLQRIGDSLEGGQLRSALESQPELSILDARQFPDANLREAAHSQGFRSLWLMPVLGLSEPIGALGLWFRDARPASREDIALLDLLARQTGVVTERLELLQASARRDTELSLLYNVASISSRQLDIQNAIAQAAHAIQEMLHPDQLHIVLRHQPDTGRPEVEVVYGERADYFASSLRADKGIVSWVLAHGETVLASDVRLDARYHELVPETRSELCAPLKIGERVLGALDVQSAQANAYSEDDVFILQALANQLAISLENARLYQAMEHRLAETTLLCDLSRHTTSSLALNQVLDSIVQQLRTVIPCRAITVFLLNEERQELTVAAASGLKQEFRERTRIRVGEGVSGVVFKEVRPMYVRDIPREAPNLGSDPSIHSLLVVPLIAKSKVIGTLSVDSTEADAFVPEHERLLTIVAAQAASAIENAQLYEAERQRAEELERAYRELQQLDQMKSQFVQNISHELRTPLTFIKGYADLLTDGAMGEMNEQQKRSVDVISKKTDAITRLVNDIITLQEIETMPLIKELTSLGDLLGMVIDTARATALSQGVELRNEVGQEKMWVMADDDRLIQVFDNLIGNAIKFSPNGGLITLHSEDDGPYWKVSVQDTGIGIPSDKLEKIFERFYQVDGSTTRRFGGTGLGLAIAREIVLGHDGKIWAESTLGQGSTFHVALPKWRGPDEPPPTL